MNTVPNYPTPDPDVIAFARSMRQRAAMLERGGLTRLAERAHGAFERFCERHAITAEMLGEPEPEPIVGDGYDNHPIITLAVDALRSWDIDQVGAAKLLVGWALFGELSVRDVGAILARFPE